VHFVFMVKEGEFAGSDHTHVENWYFPGLPAFTIRAAGREVQIDAVDGQPQSNEARSNYGFLDGHARTLRFRDVWSDRDKNRFWPDAAQ
jgi:prepilin-type processing-associated H-X9-DG protein